MDKSILTTSQLPERTVTAAEELGSASPVSSVNASDLNIIKGRPFMSVPALVALSLIANGSLRPMF